MLHHIQDGDNVGSQTGHVTPDSQTGSLCTGSDTSLFFLLLMLLRSICRQAWNQSDKFDLAIILFADVSPTYSKRWAKRRKNNKIIARRSNLSDWVIQVVSKLLIQTKKNLTGCASGETCDQEHSRCGWTNNPATWPGVLGRKVRGYPGLFSSK